MQELLPQNRPAHHSIFLSRKPGTSQQGPSQKKDAAHPTSSETLFSFPRKSRKRLTKSGYGELHITGSNGITGPLTLNRGMLRFTNAAQLSGVTDSIQIDSGALVYSGGGYLALSQPIHVIGAGATIDVNSDNGILHLTQPVTGSGGLQLSSRVMLGFPAAYTGPTTIKGLYTVSSEDFLGTSSKLQLGYQSTLRLSAPLQFQHEVEVPAGMSTFDGGGFNVEFSRLTGTGALHKIDSGLLKVSEGTGFMGRLEVKAGTVALAGSVNGAIFVDAGATLQGDASLPMLFLTGSAKPGGESTGALHIGDLATYPSSSLHFTIASAHDYDQIILDTNPSISSGTILSLQLAPDFDPVEFVDQFTLIRNDSSRPFAYTASPLLMDNSVLKEGETFFVSGQELRVSYEGGDGNDLVLYAVPEPSIGILALLSTALLGFRRNRQPRYYSTRAS